MGLLNSALQIGRSALLSYQGALQVVGNNISSAASPDYTRLSPQLDPMQGNDLTRGLQPGAGVSLTDIRRNLDEALESRLRLAISGEQSPALQQTTLAQVEAFFDDTSGAGVGARLQTFLNSFDDLQNAPEDRATRDLVLSNGSLLAESLRTARQQLIDLGQHADTRIAELVPTINELVADIADLNQRITRAEAGSTGLASGLRDQRDGLLRQLSELVDVSALEQPNGAINVYLGSEALAQGAFARRLAAVPQTEGVLTRTAVRFADTNADVAVQGGQLAGLIESRDRHAYGRLADLDRFAESLISEVNRIHADGLGLVGLDSLTGSVDVLAIDAPLNLSAAGLTQSVRNGSFYITVTDDTTRTPVATQLAVDFDDPTAPLTLEALVDSINTQVNGITASITVDRRLSIQADAGFTFAFGHDGQFARSDTSGVLAALGANTFFRGHNAGDIAVEDALLSNPLRIAAASTPHAGDGVIAGRIAALDATRIESLAGASLPEYFNSMVSEVAISSSAARERSDAALAIRSSLQAQKESVSGVSLDEEAISLLKYERAFQGTSRFISVVDGLLGELVSLIR
jgi:flagellar hook-associated protein 1 FlgK